MPYRHHRFGPAQASGQEELGGAQPLAMNVVIDETGAVSRRPGLVASSALYAGQLDPVDGVYTTLAGDTYVVTDPPLGGGRVIYHVTASGASDLSTTNPLAKLPGTARPTFAETELLLVIAGGDEMQKVEFSSNVPSRLGGSAPRATHVVPNALRLLANDVQVDRTKVRFSDIAIGDLTYAGHEVWTTGIGTAGYFTAESRPDPVVALGETTSEVWVFGQQTTQVFAPDPGSVYSPVTTISAGMSAPYSAVKVNEQYFWLDDMKRFVMSSGRGYEVISKPIQHTLTQLTTVDDCYGFRAMVGKYDLLVWVFPTDGRTFVFQAGKGWGQWSGFDAAQANWSPFIVSAHAADPRTAANYVGTSTGYLAELRTDARTDLGAPIRAYAETGYDDQGTDTRKHCKAMRFTFRRTGTSEGNPQTIFFGYRDRPGEWEYRIPIELNESSDQEVVVVFHSLGIYRRRQWFVEWSGADDIVLVSAQEEYEVLES